MQSVTLNSAITGALGANAPLFRVPLQLARAHCIVECAGDQDAWRTEPRYRYYWDNARGRAFRELTDAEISSETPPADFTVPAGLASSHATEWDGQACSWGAMQVMGAVARQHGFLGQFPALCDPMAGVRYGCLQIVSLVKTFGSTWNLEGIVAAYNAGNPRLVAGSKSYVNQDYVDKIRAAGGFQDLDLAKPAKLALGIS